MKLVQVAGYLGSGKTSLIIALVKLLSEQGAKIAVLVNDVGEIPVDGRVMQEYGLTVKDIGGGCICCQVAGTMMKTLEALAKSQQPDIIIIEPTGMAVPESIRSTVLLTSSKTGIIIGPTIVLFDTTRADKFLTYETLQRLVNTQLRDADVIALSKADAVSSEAVQKAETAVAGINPAARRQRLSVRTGEGIPQLAQVILGTEVAVS
jgi:G3E family GTPase